jgi:hypothetical protein
MNEGNLFRASCAALTVALGLLVPRAARAYCVATTCDPKVGDDCNRDVNGCVSGYPTLYWPGSCVTFAVQRDGSALNRITGAAFEYAVHQAFETWLNADCGNGTHPGIHVETLGLIECDRVEFNPQKANANAYLFRDAGWAAAPGTGDSLGLTTARFDRASGEIQDADVEINGTGGDLTNADPEDGADLLSILTHESGHFLGLDHTRDASSVMFATYRPRVSDLRRLSADDSAGICALYPPNLPQTSEECRPRNGFSGVCATDQAEVRGCTIGPNLSAGTRSRSSGLFGMGILVAFTLWRAKTRHGRG